MLRILNSDFKPDLVQRQSRLRLHNISAIQPLLYGIETKGCKDTEYSRDEQFMRHK